jgi:O-antigen/teichoic acid export membrane protein
MNDEYGRDETPAERSDRNWSELLQELRVTQTGVQLLTAFLLSLPLQQRFSGLRDYQRALYLIAVGLSVLATGLLVAPVAVHRAVFRHHEKERLVAVADRAARAGLVLLGLAISTVVCFIFGVVVSAGVAILAGLVTLSVITVLWWWLPRRVRRQPASRAR